MSAQGRVKYSSIKRKSNCRSILTRWKKFKQNQTLLCPVDPSSTLNDTHKSNCNEANNQAHGITAKPFREGMLGPPMKPTSVSEPERTDEFHVEKTRPTVIRVTTASSSDGALDNH